MTDLIHLYRQCEGYFLKGIASKCMNLGGGATAYMLGPELNFMYITKNAQNLDKILIQGKQFFDQDKQSFYAIIPEEWCVPLLIDTLYAMGYPKRRKTVTMVLKLEQLATDQTGRLDNETNIKANNDRLDEWIMPLIGAFQSTIEIGSLYQKNHENALKNSINLRHFSVYKKEKPISSITLSMNNGIARIEDVGTLPDFQNKGYASALVRYAVSEAKKLGAHHCFLEASYFGRGVYQKIGFETLFKNNMYFFQA